MKQDKIVESVRADLLDRSARGQSKYGTTLDRNDLDASEWAQQTYEELLDASLYLRRLSQELSKLPKPAHDIPSSEIASDIMNLPQVRALDLSWEQRLELHGVIEGVVRRAKM